MLKDRVIWIGCAMLFFCGVIWGGITDDVEFMKVESVHDLFEIIGAVATSTAVYIAATWKSQLGSTRDYELARKAAVIALKYRESIIEIWESANTCLVQASSGEALREPFKEALIFTLEDRVKEVEGLRAEIQEALVECRAIWRNSIEDDFSEVIKFEAYCSNCARTYLRFTKANARGSDGVVARYSINKFRDVFARLNVLRREDVEVHVEKLFLPISEKLDAKMK